MSRRARVLVVDDEPYNLDLLEQELLAEGYRVTCAPDGESALRLAREVTPDLVLLDSMMPGLSGVEVCRALRCDEMTRGIPIIFTTALSGIEHKVEAFEAGAVDYLVKPFQIEEVLARISTHLDLRDARRELEEKNAALQAEIDAHARSRATVSHLVEEIRIAQPADAPVGESSVFTEMMRRVGLVAATDTAVLVRGETGTGKELVARAIHQHSARRGQPLVKLNCAALPRELVESELFGHEKGAFTGAATARAGRFEQADGGTLFLDEVGELPLESQAKLLRVLQDGTFERLGSGVTRECDVRVIAATNRELECEVEGGRFRSDLFFRLNVFPIRVPALRERRSDIPALAACFLRRAERRIGRRFEGISPGFIRFAEAHQWPGNVRELENAVERCAILSTGPILEIEPQPTPEAAIEAVAPAIPAMVAPTPATDPGEAPPPTLAAVEAGYIRRTLEARGWAVEGEKGAARALGLNPSTLRGRMRKHGIRKPR